jgi:hypothetical protein
MDKRGGQSHSKGFVRTVIFNHTKSKPRGERKYSQDRLIINALSFQLQGI